MAAEWVRPPPSPHLPDLFDVCNCFPSVSCLERRVWCENAVFDTNLTRRIDPHGLEGHGISKVDLLPISCWPLCGLEETYKYTVVAITPCSFHSISEARRGAWGGIDWGGDISEDYTRPRQTIQSPDRLHEAPTDYTKLRKEYAKPSKTIQRH